MGDLTPMPRWQRLTDDAIDRIEAAALRILERTGVDVDVPEVLEMLRGAGAGVDGIRVRFPAHLVRQAA